jgi:hypothetical protein
MGRHGGISPGLLFLFTYTFNSMALSITRRHFPGIDEPIILSGLAGFPEVKT